MTIQKKFLARLSITAVLVTLAPAAALAGDESFSSVVKHIKANYHAKQQGFFGAMVLARFAVKVIRPAGVKNFKLAYLRDLNYSDSDAPQGHQFHSFIRSKIDPCWSPLVQYSAPREKQWTYVYVTQEKDHVKLLVVTLQRQDAVVLQTKFSPAKLAEFMNNPQIMGISLGDRSKDHSARADNGDDDDDDGDGAPKQKQPPVKPPE